MQTSREEVWKALEAGWRLEGGAHGWIDVVRSSWKPAKFGEVSYAYQWKEEDIRTGRPGRIHEQRFGWNMGCDRA